MMSGPNAFSIAIAFSGDRNILAPFKWFLKVTPSSVICLVSASEKTWKPPESVRIPLCQFINLCKPPASSISSGPGRNHRWYVFAKITVAPIVSNSSGAIVFTLACVPTGINIGVGNVPCGVINSPNRAPLCLSWWIRRYLTAGSIHSPHSWQCPRSTAAWFSRDVSLTELLVI